MKLLRLVGALSSLASMATAQLTPFITATNHTEAAPRSMTRKRGNPDDIEEEWDPGNYGEPLPPKGPIDMIHCYAPYVHHPMIYSHNYPSFQYHPKQFNSQKHYLKTNGKTCGVYPDDWSRVSCDGFLSIFMVSFSDHEVQVSCHEIGDAVGDIVHKCMDPGFEEHWVKSESEGWEYTGGYMKKDGYVVEIGNERFGCGEGGYAGIPRR